MIDTYAKAYTEVLEILKYLPKKEYDRISPKKIKFLKENMDKNYDFKFDPSKDLSKQNISREANSIIVLLFRDYFASDIQQKKLEKILAKNQERSDEYLRSKYPPDKVFKSKLYTTEFKPENLDLQNTKMTIYKENIFKKILNKIKSIFKKQEK